VVWGLMLMGMGTLFMLDNLGHIDLKPVSQHLAAYAVDGDPSTRWASEFGRRPQWLEVDLGASVPIGKVRLVWEGAYAKDYEIQLSDDHATWTSAVQVTDGDGEIDEHEISKNARYVRMQGTRRATGWGYSLWEFEVYGPSGAALSPSGGTGAEGTASAPVLLSKGQPAVASSLERPNVWAFYWLNYWPLFLIAGGLPALIVPKGDGDQVLGFLLVGAGTLLQLRAVGAIPWGFRESAPVMLILAGAMLVLHSLRRAAHNDEQGS